MEAAYGLYTHIRANRRRSFFRMLFYSGFGWRSRRSRDSDERKGSGGAAAALVIAIVLIVIAWLLSIVVRLALSRTRELLADAGSVELTKNADAMIMALRKIEGRGELAGATSAIMEMCVDNPREGFADLFATHPSIASRVEALVKFAGGHDPGPVALPSTEMPAIEPAADQTMAAEGGVGPRSGPWGPATPAP